MLTVNELFTGIGAFRKALQRLHIPHKIIGISEIDKYAIQSYTEMYGETRNYGDISKVEQLDYADLWTYGFPCQDISISGLTKGIIEGQTRSGLLFEVKRLLEKAAEQSQLPKYLILENVKNLVGKKFKADFESWLSCLHSLGYNNYWQVLNAKDYGIPQNRERVFVVSIRKDIDDGTFIFPEKKPLDIRLKDLLEENVDEKYYLSDRFIKYLLSTTQWSGSKTTVINKSTASTITTGEGQRRADASNYVSNDFPENCDIKKIGNIYGKKGGSFAGNVYDKRGISPTLNTMGGGNKQPMVIIGQTDEGVMVRNANKKGYDIATENDSINFEQPNSKTRRGRVGHGVVQTLTTSCNQGIVDPLIVASRGRNTENPSDETTCVSTSQRLEPNRQGICNTLTSVQKDNYLIEPVTVDDSYNEGVIEVIGNTKFGGQRSRIYSTGGISATLTGTTYKQPMQIYNCFRIRKLTPKECWRLMGFDDSDFEKCTCSNTQLYKQAGNSIVVNVLEGILANLLYREMSDWIDELLEI